MAALTAPRSNPRRGSFVLETEAQVAANAVLYSGALCVTTSTGYLAPGSAATTHRMPCVVSIDNGERKLDNTGGANGAKTAKILFGLFRFNNSSAGDLIAQADVGNDCYIVDDQTVAKTNGGATRTKAGKVVAVDSQGVWVFLAPPV